MSEFNIEVKGGSSVRLLTENKFCDRNILVTATGGGGYTEEDIQSAIEQGKQAEYDRFWDAFQQNGNRTDYMQAYRIGWTIENFKPKHSMFPTQAHSIFLNSDIHIDLPTTLEELGVVLDFKNCITMEYAFRYSKFTRLGVIDTTGCTEADLRLAWADCPNLKVIDKIILRKDGSTKLTSTSFLWSPNIEEIRFEGSIGFNVDFQYQSKLSAESVDSIISALKDLTGATAQTLTFYATVGAKLTETQKATITAKNWTLVY